MASRKNVAQKARDQSYGACLEKTEGETKDGGEWPVG